MIETHPSVFRTGQIVEAQLCFKAVPFKKNFVKLILQFKSLALLDNKLITVSVIQCLKRDILLTHSQDSKKSNLNEKTQVGAPMKIKRKIGYDTNDNDTIEDTTRKTQKLKIADERVMKDVPSTGQSKNVDKGNDGDVIEREGTNSVDENTSSMELD